jgi:sugar transferase (PEP-CTERM system associated)
MTYYLRHPFARIVSAAITLDAMAFLASGGLAWQLGQHPFPMPLYATAAAALGGAALCFVALVVCDAYRPENLMSGAATSRSILLAMGIAFAVALLVRFLVPAPPQATTALAKLAALYFPLVAAGRIAFRAVAALPPFSRRVMILGRSEAGVAAADAIVARGNRGIERVGFLADDGEEDWDDVAGHPVVGSAHELEKILAETRVDVLLVASSHRSAHFPIDQILHAKLLGVHVESAVSFYERITGRVFVRQLRPSYLAFSDGFRTSRTGEAVRRTIDVVAAAFGLLLALPLLALCALAIRLDSKGPVFFRQERLGRFGRTFQVLKLRTMLDDAESDSGPTFTSHRDPRITRVGRFLRMTRLDEVPQYWNILVGDMSIVGPRPERPEFMDVLTSRYPLFQLRVARKPGLTGWAQVRYGYVNDIEEFEQKLGLDLYYVKHRSLLMDLSIVLQTIKTVVLFRGL